jgi:hypothetical protein
MKVNVAKVAAVRRAISEADVIAPEEWRGLIDELAAGYLPADPRTWIFRLMASIKFLESNIGEAL